MIRLNHDAAQEIGTAATTAFPNECCGLLAGNRDSDDAISVTRVVPSRNMATGSIRDSFEVDPQVRFDLMRELADDGSDTHIVGHYHSHPNHPAVPSARDLTMAYEPDLVWVIVSVGTAGVLDIRAHRVLPDASAFQEIPLHIADAATYSSAPLSNSGDIST